MARTFRLPNPLQSRIGPLLRRRTRQQARCCTALSNQPALEAAVADLSQQLRTAGQRGEADLALVFCSTAYATDLQRLLPLLRNAIPTWRPAACRILMAPASNGWIGWAPSPTTPIRCCCSSIPAAQRSTT
jgi:hypothetical protein